MKKLWFKMMMLTFVLVFAFSGSVFAFGDIKGDPAEESILSLQQMGIISGESSDHYNPQGKVTMAQAVHLLVKAFDLNLAHFTFLKAPQASDYFTTIPDDAWYAESFTVAHLNGLPLAKDVDPNQIVTREHFAHLLMQTLHLKGDYAFIKMFINIQDEAEITGEYMNSIQELLLAKITALDESGNFYPKKELKRGEAARWIHGAMQFAKNSAIEPVNPEPEPSEPPVVVPEDVTMDVDKISDQVNKVTVSWGNKPNAGYQLHIQGIDFNGEEAVIRYTLTYPEEGSMYAQVITEPKDEAYVSSEYKVSLQLIQ